MKKSASDSKVKKTLLRNYELKAKPSCRKQVVRDVACSSDGTSQKSLRSSQKENELSQPTLCSSGAIANYISDVKKLTSPPVSSEDLNVTGQLCSKITKKLNFQFNDRIYKNLIELNASVESLKSKKDRRPSCLPSLKKDLEPNIEDFYEDEKDIDTPPDIPVMKPKFRPIKKVEVGQLHNLVAAFEDL